MTTLEYWRTYFEPHAASGLPQLDASSPATWHAYVVTALDAAGPLVGKSVLDAGCGTGALAHAAVALGAERATGFDAVEAAIKPWADRSEEGLWFYVGDLSDPSSWPPDAGFDVVWCIEAAHYVADPIALLWHLWRRVGDGGRLVVTLADARSGYVRSVSRDHAGRYAVVHPPALVHVAEDLPGVAWFDLSTLRVGADQYARVLVPAPLDDRPAHRLVLTVARS
jgi:SAM-dependent methyltransferase